jgi:hypothetical protein
MAEDITSRANTCVMQLIVLLPVRPALLADEFAVLAAVFL